MIENLSTGVVVDNRYEILDCPGSGGMGTVFSATELSLACKVAIKFLHLGLLSSEENLQRFQREGKVLSHGSWPLDCTTVDSDEYAWLFLVAGGTEFQSHCDIGGSRYSRAD